MKTPILMNGSVPLTKEEEDELLKTFGHEDVPIVYDYEGLVRLEWERRLKKFRDENGFSLH